MEKLKAQAVLSLLKDYLKLDEAEQLVFPIMQGIPILIDGRQGSTGKTTLCKGLNELGITAYERWELNKSKLYGKDNRNVFYIHIILDKIVI